MIKLLIGARDQLLHGSIRNYVFWILDHIDAWGRDWTFLLEPSCLQLLLCWLLPVYRLSPNLPYCNILSSRSIYSSSYSLFTAELTWRADDSGRVVSELSLGTREGHWFLRSPLFLSFSSHSHPRLRGPTEMIEDSLYFSLAYGERGKVGKDKSCFLS